MRRSITTHVCRVNMKRHAKEQTEVLPEDICWSSTMASSVPQYFFILVIVVTFVQTGSVIMLWCLQVYIDKWRPSKHLITFSQICFWQRKWRNQNNAKLPLTKITPLAHTRDSCCVYCAFPCPAEKYPERKRCACVAVVHAGKCAWMCACVAWTCSVNVSKSWSPPSCVYGCCHHARPLTPVISWMYRSDFIFL